MLVYFFLRQYVKQEDIPEKLLITFKTTEIPEIRIKILEVLEILILDFEIMERLFSMSIIPYFINTLDCVTHKELIQSLFKTLISIAQRYKISHLISSELVSIIQKIRDANSTTPKISKLASHFLGILDTGPRPDRARKWAVIDQEICDKLLDINAPANLSKNIPPDNTNNLNIQKLMQNNTHTVLPTIAEISPTKNLQNIDSYRNKVLLENKDNDSNIKIAGYKPEITLLENKTIDPNSLAIPGYPLQPSYYRHKYSPSSTENFNIQHNSTPKIDYTLPKVEVRRGLKSAVKRQMNTTTITEPQNASFIQNANIMNTSFTSNANANQNKMSIIQTPTKKVRFNTTDYNNQAENTTYIEKTDKMMIKLPQIGIIPQKIKIEQYRGQEDPIFDKFMDTNLLDKTLTESKLARNLLGIGVIEATGLKKATGCATIKGMVGWYSSSLDFVKAHSMILYGVISAQRAEKIMAILHLLATKKMGYQIRNPNIIE